MPLPTRTTSTSCRRSSRWPKEPTSWPPRPSSLLWPLLNSSKSHFLVCHCHRILCLNTLTNKWHTDQEQDPISLRISFLLRWLKWTSKLWMNQCTANLTTKSLIRGLMSSQMEPTKRRIWRWTPTCSNQVLYLKCSEHSESPQQIIMAESNLVSG